MWTTPWTPPIPPRLATAACSPTRSARRPRPGDRPPPPSPGDSCLPTNTLRASTRLCTPPTSYLIKPPPVSHAVSRPPPPLRIRHQCPTWVSPASGHFKKPPTHSPPKAAPCGVGRKARPGGLALGSGHWHPAQPRLTDRPPVSHRKPPHRWKTLPHTSPQQCGHLNKANSRALEEKSAQDVWRSGLGTRCLLRPSTTPGHCPRHAPGRRWRRSASSLSGSQAPPLPAPPRPQRLEERERSRRG